MDIKNGKNKNMTFSINTTKLSFTSKLNGTLFSKLEHFKWIALFKNLVIMYHFYWVTVMENY